MKQYPFNKLYSYPLNPVGLSKPVSREYEPDYNVGKGGSEHETVKPVPSIPSANKLGIEPVSRKRKKPCMHITCSLTQEGEHYCKAIFHVYGSPLSCKREEKQSDLKRLLRVVMTCKAHGFDDLEYSEIAGIMGWSRNIVSIYMAESVRRGFVTTKRESSKAKKDKP